jgi:hypothetical protein
MDHHMDDRTPADLLPVVERLRSDRPQATALELDHVKQRVRTRMSAASATGVRSRKGSPMKSRIAMLGLLVGGMLMSGTGATLAVSGVSSSGSAGTAQYTSPPPATTQTAQPGQPGVAPPTGTTQGRPIDQAQVLDQAEVKPRGGQAQPGGDDRVAPETAQVNRQVEAGATGGGSDELPFTGFAAIPILLAGVAMMASGLVLRRRSSDGS